MRSPLRIHHRLRPIPQHHPSQIPHPCPQRPLQRPLQLRRLHVPTARTVCTPGRAHIQLRPLAHRAQILAPGLEAGREARLPDVAVAVVVELHEDEIQALHRVERDRGVGARALRRRGEVVALAVVGV